LEQLIVGETDDSFDLDNLSWPQQGSKLFEANVPLSPPALLDDGPSRWWMYAESYRFAAAALVDRFRATGFDQDFLALPVLFLYRQYAELSLKFLERELSIFLGKEVPKSKGHHLLPRWMTVLASLEEVWPGKYAAENAAVGEIIGQLSAVDDGSDTFRYPVDTDGNPNLAPELKRLDLVHFAAGMEAFAHWVGGVEGTLSAEQEAQDDMAEAERDAAPRDGDW
jgi:hypothetical protein